MEPAARDSKTPLVSPSIGRLLYVPAGRFQHDKSPTNIIVITRPYYIGQYEITRKQFQSVMGTDPSKTDKSSGVSDPVQMVSWYHAIAFCNKLSAIEGLTAVYNVSGVSNWANISFSDVPLKEDQNWTKATCNWNANGYRLPTEMESMWAAMGAPADGQDAKTDTKSYSKEFAGSTGSNQLNDYAWHWDNSAKKTHPVGSLKPNELSLYDMSGNVFEWCWDYFDNIPAGTKTDYKGKPFGSDRLVRGGGWVSDSSFCAIAERGDRYSPYDRTFGIGFRVVRNEPK
ncbi:MAG TPA: SUMF1/EgtB/PvdO family nonheme iron enzyme [Spirochaetota bacterium]|nr:SUMF1/EgtB/PvdO family nonheme iron enzyme [Spirochaetota bacterium]HNU92016.1 SUMF1/EgtB/PvdO family nonheme iron enzyme [Spirochaetota bacterium]HPI14804.1 SUMF1/EgtB/PvdO family nonheme iron enzyme [Spirochaetota bacterium]HPO45413.1 SUMF1/EgtB/PvdO family nonheme iron enzyme [Spirochaetota bacterium]